MLYGNDAVMLSYEADNEQYPLETVKALHRICVEAEKEYEITNVSQKRSEPHQQQKKQLRRPLFMYPVIRM